jgi:hypothetical protein
MRAPLAQDNPPNACATPEAGFAVPLVDPMQGHKAAGLPVGVAVVRNGAAPVANPGFKNLADRPT